MKTSKKEMNKLKLMSIDSKALVHIKGGGLFSFLKNSGER